MITKKVRWVVLLIALTTVAACDSEPVAVHETTAVPPTPSETTPLDNLATIPPDRGPVGAGPTDGAQTPEQDATPVRGTATGVEPTREPLVIKRSTTEVPAGREEMTATPVDPMERETDDQDPANEDMVLSSDDQACVPDTLGQQAIADWIAAASDNARTAAIACMSEDGRRTMYTLSDEAAGLSEEEAGCTWEGTRRAWTTPENTAGGDGPETRRMTTAIIRSYCTTANRGANTPGVAHIADPALRDEMRAIYCMVDNIGGPAEFAAWMAQDPWAQQDLEDALSGQGECGISESAE